MQSLLPKTVCRFIIALVLLTVPLLSAGQEIYSDDFTSTLHSDPLNTTASWNTSLGLISLHQYELTYRGSYNTPARAYGVVVSGNYAFVADGDSGLRIINISNPAAPTLAGFYDTSANSQGIDIAGNYVFLADQLNGLLVIDIGNPAAPTLAGSYNTPDRAYQVHVAGNYAYVADRLSGVQIIDISNPTTPTLAGSYDTPTDAMDVFVSGNYAYVADNSNGFLVLDVSDPSTPTLAGSCPATVQTYNVTVSGDYAYVTDIGFGLLVIDISDPTAPAVVGSNDKLVSPRGIFVTGDYAYIADWDEGVKIFDIGAPTQPELISAYDTPDSSMDVTVAGDLVLVADWEAGLRIVNGANLLTPPEFAGSYATQGSALDVRIDGNYAYITDLIVGLQIIDISDPGNPSLAGDYTFGSLGDAPHVDIAGDYAYAALSSGDFYVFDVSDPTNPQYHAGYSTTHLAEDIRVSGDYAYISTRNSTIQVFDISDPANPLPVSGSFATVDNAEGIDIEGDYLYVAVENVGMQIFYIGNPAFPILMGTFSGGDGQDVDADGRYAYLAGIDYVRVIDISNPSSPSQAGSYYTGQLNNGITVDGDYAFISAGYSGLVILDITNPATPIPTGNLATPNVARDVQVAGDFAFIADSQSGLQVMAVYERTVDRARLAENIVQSTTIDTRDDEIVSVNLTTVQSGNIRWEVSADGGATWQRIFANYTWQGLTNTGPDLLWRALLLHEQPGDNPWCSSIQIEWCTSEGQVIVYFDEALTDVDTCIGSAPMNMVYGYVTAEGIGDPITGIEFKIESPPGYELFAEICPYPLKIGNATDGVAIAFGEIVNASNQLHIYTLIYRDQSGTCGDCSLPAGAVSVVPHPNSQSGEIEATDEHMNFVYSTGQTTHLCHAARVDDDNDGVSNPFDLCPTVSAEFFDRDGDGCPDEARSARHVEYWGIADTVTWYISEGGAPNISDGSDFTALTEAMEAWDNLPGSDIPVVYGGTTAQTYADAFDQVNMITFTDPIVDDASNRYFSDAIIAVGITTSFTEPTLYNDRWYRPGEIFDADMLFNPSRLFTTDGGAGTDLQSVATHEAGHLYGLSHSALRTSTMFPILGTGTETASLTVEDSLQFVKAYPDPSLYATANRIAGTILDFYGTPVHGAAVFAVDAATGDTTACEYTLFDGGYQFFGLPDGSYYIAVHPLNGTAGIGYVEPAAINWLVYSWGVTSFVPEYWDAAESAFDDPLARTAVPVGGGAIVAANIVTNIDLEPPTVVETTPIDASGSVRADGTILIEFSEPIEHSSLQGNFRLATSGTNQGVGGNASLLNNNTLLTFTPWNLLAYSTAYVCSVRTGITDQFGNTMAAPVAFQFTVEPQPALALRSVVPDKGVPGSVVVLNGVGFDTTAVNNQVHFTDRSGTGTTAATVVNATPYQLVATVPPDAGSGDVTVTVDPATSLPHYFSMLSASEVIRGYEIGTCNLSSPPRAHVVLPDESEAFVATVAGLSIVGVTPGLPGFCTETAMPLSGGLNDVAVTPDGRWVYSVCRSDSVIRVIDPVNRTIPFVLPVEGEPVSITIDQAGRRAYVPTSKGTIQKWDIEEGSPTQREAIGLITSPDPNLRSNIAIDPTGELLLALSGAGKMLAFEAVTGSLIRAVTVGPDPRDIVIDPTGLRAYVTDGSGDITVVSLRQDILSPVDPFKVDDIEASGSLRKAAISPAGTYLLAANRQLNLIDAVDLNPASSSFRTVVATIPQGVNPVGVCLSSKGDYAYSIVEEDQQLVVLGIGVGPAISSSSRMGGPDQTMLVLGGQDLGWGTDTVRVLFGDRDQDPVVIQPDWSVNSALGVTTPAGIPSGPVSVRTGSNPYAYSNETYFTHLEPTPPPGHLRLVSQLPIDPLHLAPGVVRSSPSGTQIIVGTKSGDLDLFDTDPTSPTLNQLIRTVDLGIPDVHDIAITPDGRTAYITFDSAAVISVIDCNRSSAGYGTVVDSVEHGTPLPLVRPQALAISPDGGTGLVHDGMAGGGRRIYCFDIDPDSVTHNAVIDTIASTVPLMVDEITFHPGGLYAYAVSIADQCIHIIDMDMTSPAYRRVVNTITIPGDLGNDHPLSCSFSPDGTGCLVLLRGFNAALGEHRYLRRLDTTDPANPTLQAASALIDLTTAPATPGDHIEVSPRGDRAVAHCDSLGLIAFDLTTTPYPMLNMFTDAIYHLPLDLTFTPDGWSLYTACTGENDIHIFDFSGADSLAYAAGDAQTGVIAQPAPAMLRVQVTSGGQPSPGVAITFRIESGGGYFEGTNSPQQTVATNLQGYAAVTWVLGLEVGEQTASATADGLSGSPIQFSATAIADPNVLPLQFSGATPLNGTSDVGVTTTIVATFSRGVDRTTATEENIFLRKTNETQPVPAIIALADLRKTVSLIPDMSLDPSTSYTLEVRAGLLDSDGGTLVNPGVSSFTTEPPPPLELTSVAPPSSAPQYLVVLAGRGFSELTGENSVYFNDLPVPPVESGFDYLKVTVPPTAESGTIKVGVLGLESNTIPFTILEPFTAASDKIISRIKTEYATKSMVINPTGTWAYAVCRVGYVIPIDLIEKDALGGVRVGLKPISLAMHPAGTYLYVANNSSGTVSVLDVDPASPDFNKRIETIVVGNFPTDLTVSPDGDRLYVVNLMDPDDSNLNIIDTDPLSTNFHRRIATVGTGSFSKSVAITPDGARLYLGTETGYDVVGAIDFGVIASIQMGTATKSVTMHPDGGLLFLLTTEGVVHVVDIMEGSTRENAVLASIQMGTATKSVAMTPDGGQLYLIQEELDQIYVWDINVTGSAGVLDPDALYPPVQITTTLRDTIYAGEDPEDIKFDPTGSGLALVSNSGPEEVTLLHYEAPPADTLTASLWMTPRTLSLKSRGRWVMGELEFDPAFSVHDVDISSILLQDTIPAHPDKWEIADSDSNGIDELTVAFDRALFQSIMPQGEYVPVSITGTILDRTFISRDTIRTIRPTVQKPNGTVLPLGTPVPITWISPEGYDIDAVDVYWSPDDGENWSPIAVGIPDAGSVGWLTPGETLDSCRVMVTIYKNGEDIGMGMNQEVFVVANSVAINITSFEGAVEANAAVLRWTTGAVGDITGFHLTRAGRRDALYERITSEVIPVGAGAGGTYVFRDTTVELNRPYYYMLEQVSDRGIEGVTGPYRMVIRAELSLEQNIPNPFNPVTTITYTIPERSAVKLAVYDVQGRLVRTLVDERMDSGFKKAVWDGRDGKGNPVASGVYFYRLKADKRVLTRKMVLLK